MPQPEGACQLEPTWEGRALQGRLRASLGAARALPQEEWRSNS